MVADDESTSPRVIWNILARVQVIKPTEMRHLFVSHTHRSPISLSNMFILHARRRRIVAEKRGEKRDLKTRLQLSPSIHPSKPSGHPHCHRDKEGVVPHQRGRHVKDLQKYFTTWEMRCSKMSTECAKHLKMQFSP